MTEEFKQAVSNGTKKAMARLPAYKKEAMRHLGVKHNNETKQKLSDIFKEYKWFNNGIENVRRKECPEGYVEGRINFNYDKEKRSRNFTGMKYWNNGIINKRARECPEGFVAGRLKKKVEE